MRLLASKFTALAFLCASLGASAFAGIEVVKFSLSDLTHEDRTSIFEQATTLGAIEAQFEYCGLKTEIVARAVRAVQACVTTDSLKEVISAFRQSKSDMETSLQSETVDCSDTDRRAWFRQTKTAIDKYIENITRMCRNCLVC